MPTYSLVQWKSHNVVVRLTCFNGLKFFLWEVQFCILAINKTKTCFLFPLKTKTLNNGSDSFFMVKTTNLTSNLFLPTGTFFLCLKLFSEIKNTKPTKTSESNYRTLTFPLHEGIRRHLVTRLDRAIFVKTSFFSPFFFIFISFFAGIIPHIQI